MRYLLRETLEEIDLKTNAPDSPSCPKCGHYNALLSVWTPDWDTVGNLLACRDCGCEVLERDEPNIEDEARAFVAAASYESILEAVRFLHYMHGASFSTVAEFKGMLADEASAREMLYNTSYLRDLFAYFNGARDGERELCELRGNSGSLQVLDGAALKALGYSVADTSIECASCSRPFISGLQGRSLPARVRSGDLCAECS